MKGYVALLAWSLWLTWIFHKDGREKRSISSAVWIVVVWAVIYVGRPISEWIAIVEGSTLAPQSRDEGSPIDGSFSLLLIIFGLSVLVRRSVQPSVLIKHNIWLVAFYVFWFLSITWSDYPFITFKRLFKDLGNIVMVLLVLSERVPVEAIKVVLMRVAHLCIPLSIILIRYFSEVGRQYVGYNQDELMYVGVATQKNTLGALAAVSAVFLSWDLLTGDQKWSQRMRRATFLSRLVVLAMCWYLLQMVDSVTALICALMGSALLLVFSRPSVRRNPRRIEAIGLSSVIILAVLDLLFDLKGLFLQSFGRNTSLTSRTDIWPIVLSHQDSPIIGAGFNTFWSGDRFLVLSESLQGIIQAHNGYLETYLNGGFVGVGLLAMLLATSYWKIRRQIVFKVPEGMIRLLVLLMALLYNVTEASFTTVGLMWLVTVYALVEYPIKHPMRKLVSISVSRDRSFDG